MSGINGTPPMLSIYDGRDCVGFLISRGKQGVELFDRDQKSIGIFASQHEAIAAISEIGGER
jgi:hypothetical protein